MVTGVTPPSPPPPLLAQSGLLDSCWIVSFSPEASPPSRRLYLLLLLLLPGSPHCQLQVFSWTMDPPGDPQRSSCSSSRASSGGEPRPGGGVRVGEVLRSLEREAPVRLSPFRMLRVLDSCRPPGGRIGESPPAAPAPPLWRSRDASMQCQLEGEPPPGVSMFCWRLSTGGQWW